MLHTPRWVNWDANKRPVNPNTGTWASSTNPSTWGTFHQARRESRHIGYVLGEGIGCIDLDHALSADGTLTPGAQALVDYYPDNWVEISPSGNGLHIWGTAPEVRGLRRTWRGQSIEFYTQGRYITVTGNTWRRGKLLPL